MKRILIFGNSGAGKSTLAKKICEAYQIAHLDLDVLAWLDTNPPERKPLIESTREIEKFLSINNGLVIEGGYADLLESLTSVANEVVFLNPGIDICVKHCKTRPWEPHKYDTKEEQDKNLEMLVGWVKQYYEREDVFSLKSHRALYSSFSINKTELLADENYTI